MVIVVKKKNYDSLDLTKFVLSIMIVAIHASLFPTVLYPWLRLAVPLFFVISSFLLFNKINYSNKKDESKIINSFIIRQLKLYLFWFIILLPITVVIRKNWFSDGIWMGLYTAIKETLFSSSFIASWFITSTIFGTLIVYKLSKKINYKILLIVFIIINVICCIESSYLSLFINMSPVEKIHHIYLTVFPSPVFSFPVSLIWILIGKLFADKTIRIKPLYNIFIIICCSLLYIEWKYVISITDCYSADCYISLIPTVILMFNLLINIDISLKKAIIFRKVSVITFPLHGSIAWVLQHLLANFISNGVVIGIAVFILTLIIVYLACFIIFKLENKKGFKLLKYSH